MQVNTKIKLLSLCIVLIGLLSVIACKPGDQSELYGTYIADYEVAREELTLKKDGTFIQKVTIKGTSKVDTSEGTWSYNSDSGYVTFSEKFMVVLDGFKQFRAEYSQPTPGLVSQPADKYFGKVLIGAAEGILYKKTKNG